MELNCKYCESKLITISSPFHLSYGGYGENYGEQYCPICKIVFTGMMVYINYDLTAGSEYKYIITKEKHVETIDDFINAINR